MIAISSEAAMIKSFVTVAVTHIQSIDTLVYMRENIELNGINASYYVGIEAGSSEITGCFFGNYIIALTPTHARIEACEDASSSVWYTSYWINMENIGALRSAAFNDPDNTAERETDFEIALQACSNRYGWVHDVVIADILAVIDSEIISRSEAS